MQSPALHYLTHWATGGFYNGTKETNMKWILQMVNYIMASTNNGDQTLALAEFIADDNNGIYPDDFAEALVKENKKFAKDLKDYLEQELNK